MRKLPVSQPCIGPAETALVNVALTSNQLTMGPLVEEFEREFAHYLGVAHAIFTTSGTTALHLSLAALGIGPGDEVLVPDLTYIASANAVTYCGATPVLVDVDPSTWCFDINDARRKATARTRAIIPVHLYGVPCSVPWLLDLAQAFNLHVIEDAAEALGADLSHDHFTCAMYSFFGNKIITTGEGGMVVTDDSQLASRLRLLRGQGVDPSRRYYHPVVGYNYRPTELQAAIGLGQLSRLAGILHRRRDIFNRYAKGLASLVGTPPCASPLAAPWLYTIQVPSWAGARDWLANRLAAYGIDTRPVFVPLHRQPPYSGLAGRRWADEDFPNASRIGDTGLSIPTYPDMADAEIDYVIRAIQAELVEIHDD